MSLFTDASLVYVPSGVKDGKTYSITPTDGSGDLTFSRGSDIEATRIGSDGLIHKAQVNLLLQSNTFSSASWVKQVSGGTTPVLTSGQEDPNGGTEGWRLQCSITGGLYSMVSQGLSTTALSCNSIWVKSNTGSSQDIYFRINNSDQTTTRTVTTEWQRIEVFTTVLGQSFTIGVRSGATGATSSCDILIYGAQNNYGLVAQDYQETTTAAVVSGITDNMPRLNYDPANPTCPSLLLEPSRSNACTFTEYNPSSGFTLGANLTWNGFVESPEGVANASRFTSSAPTAAFIQTTVTIPAGDFTFSMYVRGITGPFAKTSLYIPSLGSVVMNENMVEGEGWKRVYGTGNNSGSAVSRTITLPFYDQPAGSVFEVYGFQLEGGSYPSSLIPSYGSAATRTADACSKTGIASLIGQSAGTLFFDFVAVDTSSFQIFEQIRTTGSTNVGQIDIRLQSGTIRALATDGGVSQFTIIGPSLVAGTRYKCAVRYEANNSAFYINGASVGTDTSCSFTSSSLQQFSFNENAGSFLPSVEINQAILFPTALSNSDLATLTSL